MRLSPAGALVVVLLSSAFGAAPAGEAVRGGQGVRRVEPPVPFRVGETLTYDVSWSSFVVAGTAVVRVQEKKPSLNSTVYAVVADGRPLPLVARIYALYYRIDSLIDSFTLLPQQTSLLSEEGDRRETTTTTFDRPARKAVFERRGETTEKREVNIPTQTQDGLSTLFALRTMDLKPGAKVEMPVANDGEMFTVSISVSGAERVRVPIGEMDALKLALTILDASRQPVGQNIAIWLSTDARRLPVKLQAQLPVGDFVLALKDAK